MYSNQTTCPGCDASITAAKDVEFIQIDAEEAKILKGRTAKRMYVIACGNCEVILGGGVGALG